MTNVKITYHGSGTRIDLGREPRKNPEEAQGKHRGYIDLNRGENLIPEGQWAEAMKNPLVRDMASRGKTLEKDGTPLGIEVSKGA